MMDKIIGVTVGTPTSPKTIADKLKPVLDEQIAEAVDKYLEDNPVAGTPGKDGEDGKDGQDGAPGKDGTSPVVAVSAITGGHRITITDASGTQTVDVLDGADGKNGTDGKDGADGQPGANGQDGKPGEDGKDGVSATHSWNGTVLTVTSASGTSSADLKGAKGDQGEKGADGAKGDKGDQGIQGIQGEKGDKGDPGEKGEQGIQGEPGQKGDKGDKGDTGSQGIPGEKGDKGDTGATGANGKDGTSVTVKSVSESTADGGSNVVTFSDGKTLTVKNGKQGSAGKTPVKGVDFWTPADQEAIVQQVITALGTPIFGRMMDDANIVLSGDLADGTYTLWLEGKDGKLKELCTVEHDADAPNYTNQIPISTDKDGSIYNGTGYKANTRGNSSGEPADIANASAPNATFFTGFIPAATGSVIRLKNCFIHATGSTDTANENYGDAPYGLRSGLYNTSKAKVQVESWGNLADGKTNIFSGYTKDSNGYITEFTVAASGISFVRLCLAPTGNPADAIVTVNELIE